MPLDPISLGLRIGGGIISAVAGGRSQIAQLVAVVQRYQTIFRGMASRGLFGSQVQRRMVESREIWEQIGWAEPLEIPPTFRAIPPGSTFTVKDEWPPRSHSGDWIARRGFRGAQVNPYVPAMPGRGPKGGGLRWPDGSWFGAQFYAPAGFPPDAMPGVGRDGVHRHDYPPDALKRAQDAQPRQYLGPRPLAGAEMELRRRAFAAGGGSVAQLWAMAIREQSEREGRDVRAWTGNGWLSHLVNKPLFDWKYSDALHSGNPEAPNTVTTGLGARQHSRTLNPPKTERRLVGAGARMRFEDVPIPGTLDVNIFGPPIPAPDYT